MAGGECSMAIDGPSRGAFLFCWGGTEAWGASRRARKLGSFDYSHVAGSTSNVTLSLGGRFIVLRGAKSQGQIEAGVLTENGTRRNLAGVCHGG